MNALEIMEEGFFDRLIELEKQAGKKRQPAWKAYGPHAAGVISGGALLASKNPGKSKATRLLWKGLTGTALAAGGAGLGMTATKRAIGQELNSERAHKGHLRKQLQEKTAMLHPAMMRGFHDEMEKQAIVGVAGKALAHGLKGGRLAKYLGARAGIGAGVGAVGGGATASDGNMGRGALRGALLGGVAGAAVGGGQIAYNAARLGRAAGQGSSLMAQRGAMRGLRNAGFSRAGVSGFARNMQTVGRQRGWGAYAATPGRSATRALPAPAAAGHGAPRMTTRPGPTGPIPPPVARGHVMNLPGGGQLIR